MYTLGLNVFSHDTAAAIFKNDNLIAAIEEERFSRAKHTKEFPKNAINKCLEMCKISSHQISQICIGWNVNKIAYERFLKNMQKNNKVILDRKQEINRILSIEPTLRKMGFECKIYYYDHHDCHNIHSYSTSDFKDSALLCLDGYGETNSSQIALIKNKKKTILKEHNIHNSLGLFYSAITFFLGFKTQCDEGIIMGLSSYGNSKKKINSKQRYIDFFKKNIRFNKGELVINRKYFCFGLEKKGWVTKDFIKIFGKPRRYNDPLLPHHRNIAAATQECLEYIVKQICVFYFKKIRIKNLCLSGGVALNCVMNGKLHDLNIFRNIHIPSSPGDSGIAIGACLIFLNDYYKNIIKITASPYLGYIHKQTSLKELKQLFPQKKYLIFNLQKNKKKLCNEINDGKILATFNARSEFGPRALGNRSIITKTYPQEMKDYLNKKVKYREPFRPFAPAVLEEFANKYFIIKGDSFNMTKTFKVRNSKKIEAITHIDESARVQVVRKKDNTFFYNLLKSYYKHFNLPVLLNTSFNIKGQPIVESFKDAVKSFKSTNIDILLLNNFFIKKK